VVESETAHRTDQSGVREAAGARPVCLGVDYRAEPSVPRLPAGFPTGPDFPWPVRLCSRQGIPRQCGGNYRVASFRRALVGVEPLSLFPWATPWEDWPTLSEIFCLGSAHFPSLTSEIVHSKALASCVRMAPGLPYW
jgi:hypothetical protein